MCPSINHTSLYVCIFTIMTNDDINNLASIILRLASDMILIVDDDYDIASLS
jgi:hypothetical protein